MEAMMDEKVRKQVLDVFKNLKHPVEILFFGTSEPDSCLYCPETQQLLEEITGLSDLLTLKKYDLLADAEVAAGYHVDKAPGFVLAGREGENTVDYGIRFSGIPSGHEFSTLINDILLLSGRDSGLSQKTRSFLKSLKQPVLLQVFVTPT